MPPEQDFPQPPISQAALDSFGKFLATHGPGKESGMDFVGRMASSYAAGKDPFAEDQAPQQAAQPAPQSRSFVGDLGNSVMRGLYAIPETWAKAYEGVGRAAKDFAGVDLPGTQAAGESAESIGKSKDEAWAPPQSAQNSGTRNAITQGVESATTSLAPALAGSGAGAVLGSVVPGIGTALGAGVGGLIGLFSGVPSFAAAQYRDTMKQAEEKGVDPSTARWAALTNAASEGGTELLSDVVAAATGGTGKVLTSVGKEALKAGISPLLKQSWKPVLANMGKVFGAEASTELLNQGIQAEANKAAGIDDKSFWDAIAENAGPVGVASLIFSTVGGGLTMAGRRRVENALTNPDIHPAEREAAVKTVTNHLENIDPDAAKVWNSAANDALSNGQAIPLDEDFMGKAQIGQEAENISRAAQPSDRPIGGILQAAGLEGKPEWQQALATFDSLTEGQNAITRAMPSAGNGEQTLIPELKKGGNNGGDDSQNASADQALGPALERAWYDPSQIDERYQRGLQQAGTVSPEAMSASEEGAAPFPKTLEESSALAKQAQEQAETARQAIIDAQNEEQRQIAIQQFESATQDLARLQALPVGQGFDLIGAPQDYTKSEAASMGPLETAAQAAPEFPSARDMRDFDAGKDKTEEQLVREYQERRQRASEQEYGAKALSPLWDFLRGRVDAKSISDHYGKAVLEDLRGKAPRDIFKSRENGGMGWDKLDQEAKSQGLIPQDGDLLQSLLSNVRNKEQAQRDRINGVNEVWNQDRETLPPEGPNPEEQGLRPINSDGTAQAGVQYSTGSEATPRPYTTEDVTKAFPTGTVTETPEGHSVALPNGESIHVNRAGEISLDEGTAQAGGYAPEETTGAKPVASFKPIDGGGIISLTEAGGQELPHETYHAAEAMALTPREIAAVEKAHGNAEGRARAYQDWLAGKGEDKTGVFAKIKEFFQRIREWIAPTAAGTFRKVASGEVWNREAQPAQGGEQYKLSQPVLIRPQDGIANDPSKPERFTKDAIKGTLDNIYQRAVDQAYPALREAGKVSPEVRAALQNAISYQRGSGGVTEQLLTGKGEIYDYAKPDSAALKPGSESLEKAVSPISGDQKLAEAFDLVLKGERSLALAKFRPEILKADYLAERKSWMDTLRSARTPQERRLINGQIAAIDEQYKRGVKGVDAQYWGQRLGEVKQSLSPEEYSKVQTAAKGFRQYMRNAVLDPLHEAGILGDKAYGGIVNAPESEWYAPFQREMDSIGRQYVGSSDVIKELKGSEKNTLPAIESAIAYTQRAVRLVAQNNVAKSFIDVRDASPDLQKVITQAKVDPARVNQSNYIRVVENGVKKYYDAPKEYLQAINGMTQQDSGLFQKVMSLPAKTLRFGATMSMEFPFRNFIRDQWTAMVNSDYNYKPFIDAMRGLGKILVHDPIVKEWQASGGDQGYLSSLDRSVKSVEAKQILGLQDQGVIRYVSNPVEAWKALVSGLRTVSDYAEKATRVGLYSNAREKGATPLQAANESRLGTIDFNRMGTQGRALNQIVAFWNANVQDADILTRKIINNPGRTLSRIALGITLPSVLLWTVQHDDDRWKQIPTWLKSTCWVILPWWDKTASPICIPKPFLMGALFGSSAEHLLDYASGVNKNGITDAVKGVGEAGIPGVLPTALTPLIENQSNYSFFRGQPLENSSTQNLPPGMRANTQTQDVFRSLGQMTNISPIKMENLWRGYTGNFGLGATAGLSGAMNAISGKETPPAVEQRLTEMPGIRGLFGREPIGSASKSVDDFYKNYQDAQQTAFAYKSLLKSGDKAAAEKYYSENMDSINMATDMSDVSKKMSKIRQNITAIRQNMSMSPAEKRSRIDELSRQETAMTELANDSFDAEGGHPFQKIKLDYSVLHEQERELQKAGNFSEANKLKKENDLFRKGNFVRMISSLREMRSKVEENPRIPESKKQAMRANFDKRIKDTMDRAMVILGRSK